MVVDLHLFVFYSFFYSNCLLIIKKPLPLHCKINYWNNMTLLHTSIINLIIISIIRVVVVTSRS